MRACTARATKCNWCRSKRKRRCWRYDKSGSWAPQVQQQQRVIRLVIEHFAPCRKALDFGIRRRPRRPLDLDLDRQGVQLHQLGSGTARQPPRQAKLPRHQLRNRTPVGRWQLRRSVLFFLRSQALKSAENGPREPIWVELYLSFSSNNTRLRQRRIGLFSNNIDTIVYPPGWPSG